MAVQEHGQIAIVAESPTGRAGTMLSSDTHPLSASATDRRQNYPLNFAQNGIIAEENSVIWVKFRATATDIIESEESTMYLDVTFINKQTGATEMRTLSFNDFTGFTFAGAVDINADAGIWVGVCHYTVPAGNRVTLGWPNGLGKAYLYIGDNT